MLVEDQPRQARKSSKSSVRFQPGRALPPPPPQPPPPPPPPLKMFAARTSLRAVRSARPQVQSRLASSTTESAKEAAVSAAAKAQAAAGPALERGAALWKTATDSAGSALGGECEGWGALEERELMVWFGAAYKEPILGNVSCDGSSLMEAVC